MALPAFFDPIVNAPKPQKIVLGVFGLAIIGAAAYFLLLSPLDARVQQLRAQNAALALAKSDTGFPQPAGVVEPPARIQRL